ncbi:hypothetical protein ACFIOY_30430 [Bradyrhizobium sp. TZ2]
MPIKQNPSTSMAADALIQNLIFERDALGIVLLEPFLCVSPLANTLMWSTSPTWLLELDVDKYRHLSSAVAFPNGTACPFPDSTGPKLKTRISRLSMLDE